MQDLDSFPEAVATHQNDAPNGLNGGRAHFGSDRKAVTPARSPLSVVLRVIRRGHLYTGLFMTPWVFLYGISGFLFNHPEAFTDREARPFGRAEAAGTGLADFPDASGIAARVVEAINARSPDQAFRLSEPKTAAFSRDLTANVKGDGADYRIQLALDTGQGMVYQVRPNKARVKDDAIGGRVELADPMRDRLGRMIPALAEKLGLNPKSTSVKSAPDVVFEAESRGRVYRLTYNLQTDVLTSQDGEESTGSTPRAFLTQLHKARTFPDRIDSRWIWAVSVDATSALMILWGVSGLIMWWQIKATRRWGAVVLIVSGSSAAVLALAMHRTLFYS